MAERRASPQILASPYTSYAFLLGKGLSCRAADIWPSDKLHVHPEHRCDVSHCQGNLSHEHAVPSTEVSTQSLAEVSKILLNLCKASLGSVSGYVPQSVLQSIEHCIQSPHRAQLHSSSVFVFAGS